MKNLGDEFIWWFGQVEDRNDPLQIGRVRVRIKSWHSENTTELPTEDLPWAQTMQPVTSSATSEVGTSATGIEVGSWVCGFFMDGSEGQRPMVMGTFSGVNDIPPRAIGTNNLTKTPDSTIGEPADPYAAQFPYNKVTQTESGHVIEVDDTPDNERIHVYHKSGTFIEIHPNGDVVTQHSNGWRSVTGNDKLHVSGDFDIVIDGNANWTVSGDVNWKIDGQYNRTTNGATHLRYNGDRWTYIGADTYSRNDSGVDYGCPNDPARTGGISCTDVNEV